MLVDVVVDSSQSGWQRHLGHAVLANGIDIQVE
jgi:hypothetical protein